MCQFTELFIYTDTCDILNVSINAIVLSDTWQANCSFHSCAQSIGCLVVLNERFCTASKRYVNSSSSVSCPLQSDHLLPGPGVYTVKAYAVLSNGSYNNDCVYTGLAVLTNEGMQISFCNIR